ELRLPRRIPVLSVDRVDQQVWRRIRGNGAFVSPGLVKAGQERPTAGHPPRRGDLPRVVIGVGAAPEIDRPVHDRKAEIVGARLNALTSGPSSAVPVRPSGPGSRTCTGTVYASTGRLMFSHPRSWRRPFHTSPVRTPRLGAASCSTNSSA